LGRRAIANLADAMRMLKEQVARTPAPQWVRVVGGFTEHQFAEKRLPTLEEINAIAPDTPVFLLHLQDRALLNRAAVRAGRQGVLGGAWLLLLGGPTR
jgi:predicted amidohydrolase YtcJ